jgi:hypothetical protein
MKSDLFPTFFLWVLILLIAFEVCNGCTDTPRSYTIDGDSKDNITVARIPEVNVSTIPDLGSGSLRTNASFVAQIALRDRNVQEMIGHGSIIRGVIDFTPSRPKEWNMSAGPTLWVDYRDIDVYFYVNETEQFIERYEIVVPGYLYRKERSNNGTCLLDKNGTVVLAFNTREVWFPVENICSNSH